MCVPVVPPFQVTALGNGPDGKARRVYWSLRRAINSLLVDADGNGTMIDGVGTELSPHAVRVLEAQIDKGDDADFPLDRFHVPSGRGIFASPEWAVDAYDHFDNPGEGRMRGAS